MHAGLPITQCRPDDRVRPAGPYASFETTSE